MAARDFFFISEGSGMDGCSEGLEWMFCVWNGCHPPKSHRVASHSSQTLSAESSCGNVRKSHTFSPRCNLKSIRTLKNAAPPYRVTADPYRAAPPLHTHLTSCSTEFALRSEPSRRCVPQRPRWARRTGPRVLRSNLAEPERRLARWMLA